MKKPFLTLNDVHVATMPADFGGVQVCLAIDLPQGVFLEPFLAEATLALNVVRAKYIAQAPAAVAGEKVSGAA